MADKVDISGELPSLPSSHLSRETAHQFGLPAAMSLIILAHSIALDFWWKRAPASRTGRVQPVH